MDSKTAQIRHEYGIRIDGQYESRVSDFDSWLNRMKVSTLITAALMLAGEDSLVTARDAKDFILELADAIKEDR